MKIIVKCILYMKFPKILIESNDIVLWIYIDSITIKNDDKKHRKNNQYFSTIKNHKS